MSRLDDRCSVSLVIRDSRGYTIHEGEPIRLADYLDAYELVARLTYRVDTELTAMEERWDTPVLSPPAQRGA